MDGRNHTKLQWALHYLKQGMSIIPVGRDKRPLRGIRWKRYQSQQPSKQTVNQWFTKHPEASIAVILGPVSGNLACRDFDDQQACENWAATYPELAARLPTVATARGRHVYFRGTVRTRDLGDGELRGAGGYVVLPPSIHATGVVYEWLVPLNGDVPEVSAQVFTTDRHDDTQSPENHENPENTDKSTDEIVLGAGEGDKRIENLISSTLPATEGQRHKCVFRLARKLKGMPDYADADPRDLRWIMERWHKRALPNITTKDFAESWIDFYRGWPKVKYPQGKDIVMIFNQAKRRPTPREAMGYVHPKVRLLASLCRELQAAEGEAPFFLDCRTAGELLGVSWKTASRWLTLFCADRLLHRVEKGTRSSGRASRYRYLGKLKGVPAAGRPAGRKKLGIPGKGA